MSYNDLENKVEEAFATALTAVATALGASVLTGQEPDEKTWPAVWIHAAQGTERPVGTGNYSVTVTVSVQSSAEGTDALATHRALVAGIRDEIIASDLAATLSAAVADFYCFGIESTEISSAVRGRGWLSEAKLQIVACASDLT